VLGDEVRVPTDTRNDFRRYAHSAGTMSPRQPIDGIIVAIRDIASGRPVRAAAGDARRYVFDLLHEQTFDPRTSSKTNSQGAAPGHVQDADAFVRLQQALHHLAGRDAPPSGLTALSAPAVRSRLDGWRIIRVCASNVEVKQAPSGQNPTHRAGG